MSERKGLPCIGCAYRQEIPGNSHSRCVFAWAPANLANLLLAAKITPRTARWFTFPFNYDPLWGPDDCPNRSETRDPAKVAPPNPMADLLSLLGGRV